MQTKALVKVENVYCNTHVFGLARVRDVTPSREDEDKVEMMTLELFPDDQGGAHSRSMMYTPFRYNETFIPAASMDPLNTTLASMIYRQTRNTLESSIRSFMK